MDIINRGTIATTPGDVPDYSPPKPVGQVPVGPIYTSADVGELAARLGSPVIFDRRGNIIWFDDFEAPILRWVASQAGGGVAPVLSAAVAFRGAQSVYFYTAAMAASFSDITRQFSLLRRGKIGFEFWTMANAFAPGYLRLRMTIFDGAMPARAELRLDTTAGTITVITPEGAVVIASDIYMSVLSWYFLPIKLVIDMDDDIYSRLIVGPDEYDLSSHSLIALAASPDKYVSVSLTVIGDVSGAMYAYVDNAILSQNEPPND